MSLSRQQADEFWTIADTDGNGQMKVNELKLALQTKYNANLCDKEVEQIFCDIDKDGDSTITKCEFIDEMVNKAERGKGICQAFKSYDTSGDGKLSKDEVAKMLKEYFKEKNPDEALEAFLKFADTSEDGVITFEEFKDFFG